MKKKEVITQGGVEVINPNKQPSKQKLVEARERTTELFGKTGLQTEGQWKSLKFEENQDLWRWSKVSNGIIIEDKDEAETRRHTMKS